MFFPALVLALLVSPAIASLEARSSTLSRRRHLHSTRRAPEPAAATKTRPADPRGDVSERITNPEGGLDVIPDPAHSRLVLRREEVVLFAPGNEGSGLKIQSTDPPTTDPAAASPPVHPPVPQPTGLPIAVGPAQQLQPTVPPAPQPPEAVGPAPQPQPKLPPQPATPKPPIAVGPALQPPTTTSQSATAKPKQPLVAAYYTSWDAAAFPPEAIDFTRFDWIDFAFGVPDVESGVRFSDKNDEELLKRVIKAAHAHQKFVKLSIGGWSDSEHFSLMVSTADRRQAFATSIAGMYQRYGLDGIDLDWEYPGERGADGNKHSPQDTDNFLSFLATLRSVLPPNAVITAACQDWPFAGNDGRPIKDVSGFSKVLDWVLLMNYDIFSGSSTPGPNAPLANACGNSSEPRSNAISAAKAWMTAGFPANKILLGLPSYGYIFHSLASPSGSEDDAAEEEDQGVLVLRGDDGGGIQFNDLIQQGALQKDSRGKFVGKNGFKRHWDGCSGTPYLRSVHAHQVVSYDDPDSLQLKAEFALKAGLLGVNVFDAHGDTPDNQLLDGIRRGMGLIRHR